VEIWLKVTLLAVHFIYYNDSNNSSASKAMSDSVQYVTNAQGEKVGVLLDLETYQQLTNLSIDSELLIGLSLNELQALSESTLSPKNQAELDDLLSKNSANILSNEKAETLG
jgi:hypothetical protein